MKIRKYKNKEKGFDGTDTHSTRLYSNYDRRLYKSFDVVQSWVGGIGRHAGLISQRLNQSSVGSNFLTEVPHPAHKHQIQK